MLFSSSHVFCAIRAEEDENDSINQNLDPELSDEMVQPDASVLRFHEYSNYRNDIVLLETDNKFH